jgi:hypothetical protein
VIATNNRQLLCNISALLVAFDTHREPDAKLSLPLDFVSPSACVCVCVCASRVRVARVTGGAALTDLRVHIGCGTNRSRACCKTG